MAGRGIEPRTQGFSVILIPKLLSLYCVLITYCGRVLVNWIFGALRFGKESGLKSGLFSAPTRRWLSGLNCGCLYSRVRVVGVPSCAHHLLSLCQKVIFITRRWHGFRAVWIVDSRCPCWRQRNCMTVDDTSQFFFRSGVAGQSCAALFGVVKRSD